MLLFTCKCTAALAVGVGIGVGAALLHRPVVHYQVTSASARDAYASSVHVEGPAAAGIRFTQEPVPTGALLGSRRIVSAATAIRAAMPYSWADGPGGLVPNVHVSARYGLFSDDEYATVSPSRQRTYFYQDRPVWLVTFSGPGVIVQPELIRPIPGMPEYNHPELVATEVARQTVHETDVVVDAVTGRYLMGYA